VFAAQAPALGLDPTLALRLAAGLGAGMGRKQQVCGAITGGILALGLKYGHHDAADKAGKDRIYALTSALQDRFAGVHGTVVCRDLLGCDLTTAEGQAEFTSRNLVKTVCARCVQTSHRIVNELIKENP
jgi:C_GCAxxG_C_C family probable redox protein